ncbi:hypothetical protein B4W72_08860 [Staphylococcus delphini]|uniref:Uncharacterized protein n=1 Tax=Staphylococcus delphini TaxID=53344 RepID=A0A2A4GXB3_9STAP|nr:hypothetical protein B5C08_06910 [Staphylococcus delphini]PCF60330.1 hypothetical protein B5C01_10455 [Staphylococcus delphini]PCF72385.1 hypothetical protein B4W72_08860 [Staphylococcus delphini]
MNQLYKVIQIILIILTGIVMINGIFNHDDMSKLIINVTVLLWIILMVIVACIIRKIHEKKN